VSPRATVRDATTVAGRVAAVARVATVAAVGRTAVGGGFTRRSHCDSRCLRRLPDGLSTSLRTVGRRLPRHRIGEQRLDPTIDNRELRPHPMRQEVLQDLRRHRHRQDMRAITVTIRCARRCGMPTAAIAPPLRHDAPNDTA